MNDFDTIINRRETSSLKWDWYKGKDVIPLWVADMDFRAPEPVLDALHKRVAHGVMGYTLPPDEVYDVIIARLKRLYNWEVQREWILCLPGVVAGLNLCCRSVGAPGDRVAVPVPVYPPFFDAPELAGRSVQKMVMTDDGGRLTFDFRAMEQALEPKTSLFLLCSPHNPGGTVFKHNELEQLADICLKNGIIICSDEIHCDLVLDDTKTHIPTAAIDPEVAKRTITLMAPSKTYNIPGMGFSFAVIPDASLRNQFKKQAKGIVPEVNLLGYTAAIAAYRHGDEWLSRTLDYLRGNRELVSKAVATMKGVSMIFPESTYLAWIDTRDAGINNPVGFFEKAGVGLSDGKYFGMPGFVRLNFGCSRPLLEKALSRMAEALMSQV